jgi:sialic acid synthase SpsE
MSKVFVVSELGCNAGGSLQKMKDMMLSATDCGCDFVKGQVRCPKILLSKARYDEEYNSPNSFGKTYGEHREALEFNEHQWNELFSFAENHRIKLFNSVFDIPSAEMMAKLGMKMFKIGSSQTDKLNLIKYVTSVADTIMISTGMSTWDEVYNAWVASKEKAVLFHTTSAYPTKIEDINLGVIERYRSMCHNGIGLSGHHLGYDGAIEACAIGMGVTFIERHYTLNHNDKGSDQYLSLEPLEMGHLVKVVRSIEKAMGDGTKKVLTCEQKCREIHRGN